MSWRFLLGIWVVLPLSGSALAEVASRVSENTSTITSPNIRAGNWNLGGYFDFVKTSGREDGSEYSASITGRYFLIDRLSLGLGFGVDGATGDETRGSVGPTAAYYFWSDGKLASYVGA